MSGSGPMIIDWQDVGGFTLQHHDDEVEIDLRHMLVGARVPKDPEEYEGLIPIAKEDGRGTLGDIHPWRYWSPKDRESRHMGAWSMVFPAVAVKRNSGKGPITPSESSGRGPGDSVRPGLRSPSGSSTGGAGESSTVTAVPIFDDDYSPDRRFRPVAHNMPEGYPEFPEGYLCLAVAGMDERSQQNLLFPVDARLIAVNWSPSAEMGTIVVDLDPADTMSRERWARLQSAWRVVRMPDTLKGLEKRKGNALCWQLGPSQQDSLAGYGAAYGKVDGGGGDGGGGAQTTPTDTSWHGEQNPNQGHGAQSSSSVNAGNIPGTRYGQDVDPHYGKAPQGPPGGG